MAEENHGQGKNLLETHQVFACLYVSTQKSASFPKAARVLIWILFAARRRLRRGD